MDLNKRTLYLLGLLTLVGFSTIGVLVLKYGHERDAMSVFDSGLPAMWQLILGFSFGSAAAMASFLVIYRNFFTPVRVFFQNLFSGLRMSIGDIIFISICAGVGEEMLFRGAIQPYLGIWPTAVVFIILHGYLNPMNWRLTVYGLLMVVISAGFGYLYEHVGMISAMTAHAAIDLILLLRMTRHPEVPASMEQDELHDPSQP